MSMFRSLNALCITVVFVIAVATTSPAQTLMPLGNFSSSVGPGPLTQTTSGHLIGTTLYGGIPGETNGSVFDVTQAGPTNIYDFCSLANCADGAWPNGPLLLASDGNYYGTTQLSGIGPYGTVFKITPQGELSTIHTFCSLTNCADGAQPTGPLVQGRNGHLYGITAYGGSGLERYCPVSYPCGTIFEITTSGAFTTLYNFCSKPKCSDGEGFGATLILGADGNFYGTTSRMLGGEGTFFRMSPSGNLTTVYRFCYEGTSCSIQAPLSLVEGSDGNFYGMAFGENGSQSGIVFKITQSGGPTVLYSFCSLTNCADGELPLAGLIEASDGNFYGTTAWGGETGCIVGCGTIFRITPAGELTTLYDFCSQQNCSDGGNPSALLTQGTDGALYGTTNSGGNSLCNSNDFPSGCGNVFRFSTGLGPFIKPTPAFGTVGYKIRILGNHLTGATSVSFNGTVANFKVVSDTYIQAEVPTGATTGAIAVATPNGTLSSNVLFQVIQ